MIDDKITSIRRDFLEMESHTFDVIVQWGESPIECLLVAELMANAWRPATESEAQEILGWLDALPGIKTTNGRLLLNDELEAFVNLQLSVSDGDYRIDFAFFAAERRSRLVVELDGHDFHERTKEQAARDRRRDRRLQDDGWRVMRFTGSEIWRNSGAVHSEIHEFLMAAIRRLLFPRSA